MDLNTEQKIDYIFESIKKREKSDKRALFFKWGFRIFMLAYLYYFIAFALPWLIQSFIPSMPSFGGNSDSSIDAWSLDRDVLQGVLENYLKN